MNYERPLNALIYTRLPSASQQTPKGLWYILQKDVYFTSQPSLQSGMV
jgi:hypothetical protein